MEVSVLVLRFFMFLSAVSSKFSLVFVTKYIMGIMGGSVYEKFEDNKGGIFA